MSLATINSELGEVTGTSGSLVENLKSLIAEVDATYTAIEDKGGTAPANKNTENMATAIGGIE